MGVEPNVLALEAEALQNARRAAVAAGADLAARIDHAVPRYPTAIIERAQGVADKPRLAAESGELRDLAASCHPTPWNSRDDCVDPFVATRRGRHQRKCIGMLARLRKWREWSGTAKTLRVSRRAFGYFTVALNDASSFTGPAATAL